MLIDALTFWPLSSCIQLLYNKLKLMAWILIVYWEVCVAWASHTVQLVHIYMYRECVCFSDDTLANKDLHNK